jgi:environmental stress-induced protein Ves
MAVAFRGKADFTTMPWRNGLGHTVEMARGDGAEGFLWRISRAAVTQNGPFSTFPQIDRILFMLSGAGLIFNFGDGRTETLNTPFAHLAFPGDAPLDCTLLDGPCEDLNLMVDRRWGTARAQLHRQSAEPACAAISAFIALNGSWQANGQQLETRGMALATGEASLHLTGAGTLLQADFAPR